MNGIQETEPDGQQCNILLDTVATIVKYKKNKIDHDIYLKVFSDGTVSYLIVCTADFSTLLIISYHLLN